MTEASVQTSVTRQISFTGVGLHLGAPVRLVIHPAPAGMGILFWRSDIGPKARIPARWDHVEQTPLCTRLIGEGALSVSTVEHVMAALAGCGVTNALIEVDGPEVPILDGSAAIFVTGILKAGLREQSGPREIIRVLKPVEVTRGDATARLLPDEGFSMRFEIEFDVAAIGRQEMDLTLENGTFVRELADSRTFCRRDDVEAMRKSGLALGGTFENAVVFDGDDVLSPGGLRHEDEPVRHKMLDALGDLYMAGAPLVGRYEGVRAGHALTNALLRALFADETAWRRETCDTALLGRMPGAGVGLHDLALSA